MTWRALLVAFCAGLATGGTGGYWALRPADAPLEPGECIVTDMAERREERDAARSDALRADSPGAAAADLWR